MWISSEQVKTSPQGGWIHCSRFWVCPLSPALSLLAGGQSAEVRRTFSGLFHNESVAHFQWEAKVPSLHL